MLLLCPAFEETPDVDVSLLLILRKLCWVCCSAEQAREKYRNSSCYFVGPILATPMNKSLVFADSLAQAVEQSTVQNPWALGAVLGGIQVFT